MSDEESLELMKRAVSGDQQALTELLEACGPIVRQRLANAISPLWRSAIDEDDVMQVSYMEAFLRIDRFQPSDSGSFTAWLTRIAQNNLRDAIKELEAAKRPNPRRRAELRSPEDSCVALVEMLGATSTTPSRQAAREEAVNAIDHALALLPPDYAKVIRMYDLEGRDAAEVAAAIGRSKGAVFMLRARAHDRLREIIGAASRFFSHPG